MVDWWWWCAGDYGGDGVPLTVVCQRWWGCAGGSGDVEDDREGK